MKKTLLFFVALFTATIAFASVEIDGIYYNLNDETKTAEVTYQYHNNRNNYSGVTTVTIPSSVAYNSETYSVTSIGEDAFSNCSSLTSITIPNSVTSVGEYAFKGTSWLNNQPNGCVYASSCLYMYKGTMPANTHIDVKEGTTQICREAFYNCKSLTSITIPNSVTSIGVYAFYNCSSLISITIEATTPPTLGTSVFEPSNINAVYIPDNTLSTYKEAWGTDYIYVNNETTLTINVETPGTLSDLIFDAGQRPTFVVKLKVTGTLNDDDFTCMHETMTSLVDVDLSEITNTTGVNFNEKSNLVKIILPNNLTSIGYYAFSSCSSLTSITIPDSVTSIKSSAFERCSSLKSISIPNSVTSFGDRAFYSCPLKSINITAQSIEDYYNSNIIQTLVTSNARIDLDRTEIHLIINNIEITDLIIPETLNTIKDKGFWKLNNLKSITIPNSVTSIGSVAFASCSSLTSITIPNSVTSIGYSAFSGCSSLTSISIPNSVTSIGEWAFASCSSLTSITIGNSVTEIGGSAFGGCELDTITCLGSTPPAAENLEANTQTCVLVVPKVAYTNYLRHAYWGQFFTIETIDVDYKTITAIANNSEWGFVEGGDYYDNGKEATLTAIANEGYRFVKWDDEVTDNPRTIVVTQDSAFTAIFEPNTFTITTAVNDEDMGSVTEGGEYAHGTEVTLSATANAGYRFAQWSDGNTDNPRIVTVTENKTYTAEFEVQTYTITTAAAVPSMGGVKVTLTAEPIEGLVFNHWSDGNTENPRTLTLTEDIELYAYFKLTDATNVETSKISSANIYTTNGTLHLEGATENYHILDAAGRLIYTGNATTLQLPRGIYLITINGEVEKIAL